MEEYKPQAIDIILGGPNMKYLAPPIKGYVVTFPDSRIDTIMLKEEEATPEKLEQLKAKSKWPGQIFYRKAWLHTEQIINGNICSRKFWEPR